MKNRINNMKKLKLGETRLSVCLLITVCLEEIIAESNYGTTGICMRGKKERILKI